MYIPFLEVCTCITGYNRFINFYKIIKATPKQIKRKRKIDRGIMKELIAYVSCFYSYSAIPFPFRYFFFYMNATLLFSYPCLSNFTLTFFNSLCCASLFLSYLCKFLLLSFIFIPILYLSLYLSLLQT